MRDMDFHHSLVNPRIGEVYSYALPAGSPTDPYRPSVAIYTVLEITNGMATCNMVAIRPNGMAYRDRHMTRLISEVQLDTHLK